MAIGSGIGFDSATMAEFDPSFVPFMPFRDTCGDRKRKVRSMESANGNSSLRALCLQCKWCWVASPLTACLIRAPPIAGTGGESAR